MPEKLPIINLNPEKKEQPPQYWPVNLTPEAVPVPRTMYNPIMMLRTKRDEGEMKQAALAAAAQAAEEKEAANLLKETMLRQDIPGTEAMLKNYKDFQVATQSKEQELAKRRAIFEATQAMMQRRQQP